MAKKSKQIEGTTLRRTQRYQWAWRHLDFSMRLALFFAHRLPRGHPDRTGLAHVIRKIVRKQVKPGGSTMYSFLMNDEKCPHCGVNLVGEGTVTVADDLQRVNEALRIVENISDGSDLHDTDVILDLRCPEITCAACGGEVDFSYNEES